MAIDLINCICFLAVCYNENKVEKLLVQFVEEKKRRERGRKTDSWRTGPDLIDTVTTVRSNNKIGQNWLEYPVPACRRAIVHNDC